MYVVDVSTGKNVQVEIESADQHDFASIQFNKSFVFDWESEREYDVYKLVITGSEIIAGLISLDFHNDPEEGIYAVECRLIERREYKKKNYARVSGLLLAYAARLSFDAGLHGFVYLKPKAQLIPFYINQLGFRNSLKTLHSDTLNSIKLIREYLED